MGIGVLAKKILAESNGFDIFATDEELPREPSDELPKLVDLDNLDLLVAEAYGLTDEHRKLITTSIQHPYNLQKAV